MELRDLLELLYSARKNFDTIHVSWEYWANLATMNRALKRWVDKRPAGSVAGFTIGSAQSEDYKIHERIWWQKPDCWRWEVMPEDKKQFDHIKILCHGNWWHFMPANNGYMLTTNLPTSDESDAGKSGKIRQEQAPTLGDLVHDVPIVDPVFLLATHDLQFVEDSEHIGRLAVRVKAVPERFGGLSLEQQFWSVADEYQLLIDKERGILLRYSAWFEGEEYAVASVGDVIFDDPIPQERFVLTP